MSVIKLFLDTEEHDRVQHYAESLGVSAEDVAYAALNRLMHEIKRSEDELAKEIVDTRDSRHPTVAYWSETIHSIHVGAGAAEIQETRSPWH
jgi:hypothetical protein